MPSPSDQDPRFQSARLGNEAHEALGGLTAINRTLWQQLDAVADLAAERKQTIATLERDLAQVRTELHEAQEALTSTNGHGDVADVETVEVPASP